MRKWIGWSAAVLVLIGVLLPFLPVLLRPSRITRATVERIEPGMTRTQVEEIVGCPPGIYLTRPIEGYHGTGRMPGHKRITWAGDEGLIIVYFDGGVVSAAFFGEAVPEKIGPFGLMAWRLEQWKDKWFP